METRLSPWALFDIVLLPHSSEPSEGSRQGTHQEGAANHKAQAGEEPRFCGSQMGFGPGHLEITGNRQVFAAGAISRAQREDPGPSELWTRSPGYFILANGLWQLNGSPGRAGFHCEQLFKSRLREAKCFVLCQMALG